MLGKFHLKSRKRRTKEKHERLFDDNRKVLIHQTCDDIENESLQFRKDVEEEILWIAEKIPLANFTEYGNNLFQVKMLQKKNQSLQTEVDHQEMRNNVDEQTRIVDDVRKPSLDETQR
ncbi:unnamed protein product [Ceutorhynchus assimilis]|uniref:Uncharacterized protein n=1 Tax=Ceutorhynchus assimilis TaxID=467358 RepID=A0A9N9MI51_9CUCU|nr:unnamed protein product [Ceutorhynchus assimilis]